MKYKTLVSTAVLLPTLLAFTVPGDRLEFSPSKGSTVTKIFTQEWEMTLDEMEVLMNGQDSAGMMPEMEMTMNMHQVLSIADTYGDILEGNPTSLERKFNELTQDMKVEFSMDMMGEVQEQNQDITSTTELEGTTVKFVWDDEEEEYTKTFADEETDVDEEKLDGLTEDMDLRFLLPEDAVQEGDEWSLELENLIDLMAPGGDFAWDVEVDGVDPAMGGGPNPEMMGNMREMMAEMLEGEATATFVGMEDGLAVIELSIEIDGARDMTDLVAEMMAEAPEGMAPEVERMDIEFTIEATGKALWNIDEGHIAGLTLEGDMGVSLDMEMSIDMGQAMTFEVSLSMSGSLDQSIEVE